MRNGRGTIMAGIGLLAFTLMKSPAAYAQGQTGTAPHKKQHKKVQHHTPQHRKPQHRSMFHHPGPTP